MAINFSDVSSAGGTDSGGTVIASASNADANVAFYLTGPFPAGEYVISFQGTASSVISVLSLSSTNEVLQQLGEVQLGSTGGGSTTITLSSDAQRIAISGLSGYCTISQFETPKVAISVGATNHSVIGSTALMGFYFQQSASNQTAIKENSTHYFVPHANSITPEWVSVSKTTGLSDMLYVRPIGVTGYDNLVVLPATGPIGVKDGLVMTTAPINFQSLDYNYVLIFTLDEQSGVWLCDLNESGSAVFTGGTGSGAYASVEYISSQDTWVWAGYGDNYLRYSNDSGATWTQGGTKSQVNQMYLQYFSEADALILAPGPATTIASYWSDMTDLSANGTQWNLPATRSDWMPWTYNSNGFWTVMYQANGSSVYVATALGGSWTTRNVSLYSSPGQIFSHNGYTVAVTYYARGSSYSNAMAWSSDGVTWNIDAGTAEQTYFGTNLSYLNQAAFADGDYIRWLGNYGGFAFNTSTGQPALAGSPLGLQKEMQFSCSPDGQYWAASHRQGDYRNHSADGGRTWTSYLFSSLKNPQWWNGKFWWGVQGSSTAYTYEPLSGGGWQQDSVSLGGSSYDDGLVLLSSTEATRTVTSTSGVARYTTDGGNSWVAGREAFSLIPGNDGYYYGLNGSSLEKINPNGTFIAATVGNGGGALSTTGIGNYGFGIPYKNGVLYATNASGNILRVLYVVNGTAETADWNDIALEFFFDTTDAFYDKGSFWTFAGKLFLEITSGSSGNGAMTHIATSSDNGQTWLKVDTVSPGRNFLSLRGSVTPINFGIKHNSNIELQDGQIFHPINADSPKRRADWGAPTLVKVNAGIEEV